MTKHPAILPAAVAGITMLAWLLPRPGVPAGLTARYYAGPDWSGAPIAERVDAGISSAALADCAELHGLSSFSVEWTGTLIVRTAGLHRVATKSDDGSWLWIDDRLVIDNGGIHPTMNVAADVHLSRGAHAIRVRYSQAGGESFLQLGQAGARGRFGSLGPLVPGVMSYAEFRARELWPLLLVALWYIAVAATAWLAVRRVLCVPHLRALSDAVTDRTFLIVALAGVAVSAAHIGYGLPAYQSFPGDELEPLATLAAAQNGFRTWNLRWPTLHFHMATLALQPFACASTLFDLPLSDPTVNTCMMLAVRGLSVLALFATLLLTFDAACMLANRAAGYFAVALLASMPVVVYYGSLANLDVPQMFWGTLAFWSWVRFIRQPTLASSVVLGAAVGLGLASKDQLYGFYLAAPLAVAYVLGREDRSRGPVAAALAASLDRRFLAVGVATVAGFAIGHQLPFEWQRFVAHVRSMTTVDSVPFRMFTHSPAGHAALLAATAKAFGWAAGVPASIAFASGCIHLMLSGRRRLLASLLLPLATYYAGFLAMILYVYDRFLIAFLPVVAIVGGTFLHAIVRAPWSPRILRVAVPTTVLAAALANAVGIDVVFAADPRHRAARWIADNLACGSSVGVTYNTSYLPPLDCYEVVRLTGRTVDAMTRYPDHLVFNVAYARRFERTLSGGRFMARLRSGDLGYSRVLRAETTPPRWAPLYWERRFWNREEDGESALDKPLHTIEVWTRR